MFPGFPVRLSRGFPGSDQANLSKYQSFNNPEGLHRKTSIFEQAIYATF
jgi:hypothetical protein